MKTVITLELKDMNRCELHELIEQLTTIYQKKMLEDYKGLEENRYIELNNDMEWVDVEHYRDSKGNLDRESYILAIKDDLYDFSREHCVEKLFDALKYKKVEVEVEL